MKPIESLRTQERDALLIRLRALLQDDPRVSAAWLYGSLGRGEGDAWSDLDVWVVLRNEDYDPSLRHAFASRLGETLFTEEAPQNGPAGGTYLMAAYDAPSGPHLVDWYFQPESFARETSSQQLFVSRTSLSTDHAVDAPRAPWAPSAEEDVQNKVTLFWAMLLVQAKWIARRPNEEGLGFEEFLRTLLHDVCLWGGATLPERETSALRTVDAKLARLRRLGDSMAEIVPVWSTPKEAIARFFDSVRESVVEDPVEERPLKRDSSS